MPAEFVEALLPGAAALLQWLRSGNQQAQLRPQVDHSEVYFVEAAIRLAQTFWRALPFKLQRYGAAYLMAMAQLPAVKAGAVRPAVAGLPAAGAAAVTTSTISK